MKEYKAQVNLNLPVSIITKIDELAKEKGLTRTAVITDLVVSGVSRNSGVKK